MLCQAAGCCCCSFPSLPLLPYPLRWCVCVCVVLACSHGVVAAMLCQAAGCCCRSFPSPPLLPYPLRWCVRVSCSPAADIACHWMARVVSATLPIIPHPQVVLAQRLLTTPHPLPVHPLWCGVCPPVLKLQQAAVGNTPWHPPLVWREPEIAATETVADPLLWSRALLWYAASYLEPAPAYTATASSDVLQDHREQGDAKRARTEGDSKGSKGFISI